MAIGYACLLVGVPGTSVSGCTLKNASEENIRRLIAKNLEALEVMLDYNDKNNIKLFRISSDLIPFGSHPINSVPWWLDYREQLEYLGAKIKSAGMRVSMHPGQYTVLNSTNPEVVEKARKELSYHARFLDTLGVDRTNKLILHVGGVYGNKTEAANNFVREYQQLPQEIRHRLVIENDERCFTIQEVLQITQECGAPVIFDNLHHRINPSLEQCTDYDILLRCRATWRSEDGRQKMHYSQQREYALPGSHSDTIYLEPFLEYYRQLRELDPDIMLEVKDKNLSTIKCNHVIRSDTTSKELESEWARYQYYILSKDVRAYQEMIELLKAKSANVAKEFYTLVEKAALMPEEVGAQVNAAQHIWGYYKNDCTAAQKRRYEKLMESYTQGNSSIGPLKNYLLKEAIARELDHLTHSLYFIYN